MDKVKPKWQEVPSLGKVTCSAHDCERDLHCFRSKRPIDRSYRNGRCVACGIDLIDWDRVDKRNLSDVAYTIQALEHEMFRHHYWHKTVDDEAILRARKKGLDQLRNDAEKRIVRYLSPPSKEIFRDGTQTPLRGNAVYYAQHATATCCRKCAEEWHGIDRNRPLTKDEIKYMVDLIMLYIEKRLPFLTKTGEIVLTHN